MPLLAQHSGRSVKAQDDITPVERCGGARGASQASAVPPRLQSALYSE